MKFSRQYVEKVLQKADPGEVIHDTLWMISCNPEIDSKTFQGMCLPARNIQLFVTYAGEVANGGHLQFFWNSYGDFTPATQQALDEIGLHDFAQILRKSGTVFPNGHVPTGWQSRQLLVGGFEEKKLDLLYRQDHQLWNIYNDSAFEKVLGYLMENQKEIMEDVMLG